MASKVAVLKSEISEKDAKLEILETKIKIQQEQKLTLSSMSGLDDPEPEGFVVLKAEDP